MNWLTRFPEEVRNLDTHGHALIEASAGTGKTYAIEHLVLRLLVENPGWKPEEILLLSFTEKTATELRQRIRDKLREQISGTKKLWDWDADQHRRIHDVWLHCDDLSVYTIHGFCHAAMLRDPLANGTLIRPEVVDDRTLADKALENLLRNGWTSRPERLTLLRESLGINAGEKWRDRLIELALAYQPWRGDSIEPIFVPGEVEQLEARAEELSGDLRTALQALEEGAFPRSAFRQSFGATKTGLEKLRKHPFNKVFEAEESWGRLADEVVNLEVLRFFAKSFTKASVAVKSPRGFAACLPPEAAALPEWNRLAHACTDLRKLGPEIETAQERRRLGIFAEAAIELRQELGLEKRRRGAISYDDMQKNLALAFRERPGLALKLRNRYKSCIVDEFQDTDSLQWGILHALCLPTEAGRFSLPLFLVGDPKQAIYGFRGGDLGTYLQARSTLRNLAQTDPPEAQGVSLRKNFRSRPELVEGLNAVFSHPEWFEEAAGIPEGGAWHLPENSDKVVFTPALPGRKDPPAGPAIYLRDFRDMENNSKVQVEREVRRWITARILDLVGDAGNFRIAEKGHADPVAPRFGHIAVLVRKHAEAEALERTLRTHGIPCRVRRQGGIFQGPGAEAIRLLIDLIPEVTRPETQAKILLLPFLRREGTDWPHGRPATCPPLLERWGILAGEGRWPEFFDSVLYESGYLDRLARESGAEAERLAVLARTLGEAGSAPGMPAHALGDRFDALRRGEGTDEGAAPGDDIEDNRVTLMTLHMSKGLEFPVVFLAALGEGKRPEFYTLREPKGFRHNLNKKDAAAQAAHEQQSADEERRLFYVAFTRAMERLYVPLLPENYSGSRSGPLGGFAATALDTAAHIAGQAGMRIDTEPVSGGNTGLSMEPVVTAATILDRDAALRDARGAFARRRRLDSYSGLARRAAEHVGPEELLEADGTRTLREEYPRDSAPDDSPDKNGGDFLEGKEFSEKKILPTISREDLPAGAAAGNALHKLLEHTDFATVLATDSAETWGADPFRRVAIENLLRQEGLDTAFAGAAARAAWNTLRMKLPDPAGGPDFRLAEVSERRHELEFLFPFTGNHGEFLQGFIDLVFRHRDRYYLLDWKSNLLEQYDEASIAESMREHHYDLQWQIYSVALDRWLAARLPEYEPAHHFGGVYYVYLRGAAADHFSGFAHRPSVEDLRITFPALLGRAMGHAEISEDLKDRPA